MRNSQNFNLKRKDYTFYFKKELIFFLFFLSFSGKPSYVFLDNQIVLAKAVGASCFICYFI